jgi:hypothetical protein
MTAEQMTAYLRDNGYPEHIVQTGPAGLIAQYAKFVSDVERGYKSGLEEYRRQLDLRGVIALFGLDEQVAGLDRRFEAMLTNRDKRVWESSSNDPSWDYGYPNSTGTMFL